MMSEPATRNGRISQPPSSSGSMWPAASSSRFTRLISASEPARVKTKNQRKAARFTEGTGPPPFSTRPQATGETPPSVGWRSVRKIWGTTMRTPRAAPRQPAYSRQYDGSGAKKPSVL